MASSPFHASQLSFSAPHRCNHHKIWCSRISFDIISKVPRDILSIHLAEVKPSSRRDPEFPLVIRSDLKVVHGRVGKGEKSGAVLTAASDKSRSERRPHFPLQAQ